MSFGFLLFYFARIQVQKLLCKSKVISLVQLNANIAAILSKDGQTGKVCWSVASPVNLVWIKS